MESVEVVWAHGTAQKGGETPRPSKPCTRPPGSSSCSVPAAGQQEDVYGHSNWVGAPSKQGPAEICQPAGRLQADPWLKIIQRCGCANLNKQDLG